MTVIQTDFVPIVPYDTDHQFIGIGQRYDVIVTATSAFAKQNVWFRATPQLACGDNVISNATARAIVRYMDAPISEPSTTEVVFATTCRDPPMSQLVPVVPLNVLPAHQQMDISVTLLLNKTNDLVFDVSGTASANDQPSSLYLDYKYTRHQMRGLWLTCEAILLCTSSTMVSRNFHRSITLNS